MLQPNRIGTQAISLKNAGSNNKRESVSEKGGSFEPNEPPLDPPLQEIDDTCRFVALVRPRERTTAQQPARA